MTGYVASQFLSKRLYAVSTPPVLPKEHTDLPFDVKALTRIPKEFADPRVAKQLLPTMSSAHSSHLYYFPSAYAVSGGDNGLYIVLLHIGNQGLPAGCVEFAHYVIQEKHRIFPCFLSDELNF